MYLKINTLLSNVFYSAKEVFQGDETSANECLQRLHEALQEPIPDKPSAKYITDRAQLLVDQLNEKRKNDELLLELLRQALEMQVVSMFTCFNKLIGMPDTLVKLFLLQVSDFYDS